MLTRIKFIVCSIICVLCSALTVTAQKSKQKVDFFDDKATLIPVFTDGIGIVSEGPAMSPDGLLYFADVSLEKTAESSGVTIQTTGKQLYFVHPVTAPVAWLLTQTETYLSPKE